MPPARQAAIKPKNMMKNSVPQLQKAMRLLLSVLLITVLSSGILQAQERTTVNVKDLPSGIEKYLEKNYKGFKTNEDCSSESKYQGVAFI